jgi:hypothetical protein
MSLFRQVNWVGAKAADTAVISARAEGWSDAAAMARP